MPTGRAPELIGHDMMRGIDYVFLLNLLVTQPTGTLPMCKRTILANADGFDGNIVGRGRHGAEPPGTVDALRVAREVVTPMHYVLSRVTSPFDTLALTNGKMSSGTARNVIAERAYLFGTVHTLSDSAQERVDNKRSAMCDGIASTSRARTIFRFDKGLRLSSIMTLSCENCPRRSILLDY